MSASLKYIVEDVGNITKPGHQMKFKDSRENGKKRTKYFQMYKYSNKMKNTVNCEKHRNGKQILQTVYDKQPNTDDTKTN